MLLLQFRKNITFTGQILNLKNLCTYEKSCDVSVKPSANFPGTSLHSVVLNSVSCQLKCLSLGSPQRITHVGQ